MGGRGSDCLFDKNFYCFKYKVPKLSLNKNIVNSEEFQNYLKGNNQGNLNVNLTDEQKLLLYRQRYKIEYLKEKWPQPSKLFQSYLFINGTKDRVWDNTKLIKLPLGYLLLMAFFSKKNFR